MNEKFLKFLFIYLRQDDGRLVNVLPVLMTSTQEMIYRRIYRRGHNDHLNINVITKDN